MLHARHFLHAASWSLSRTPAGDIVHFLHVVPQSQFTSVIQQSEQQEEMLVGQTLFIVFWHKHEIGQANHMVQLQRVSVLIQSLFCRLIKLITGYKSDSLTLVTKLE